MPGPADRNALGQVAYRDRSQLIVAVDDSPVPRRIAQPRGRFSALVIASATLHVGAALALMTSFNPSAFDGGTLLETISVSLVDARDIDPAPAVQPALSVARASLPVDAATAVTRSPTTDLPAELKPDPEPPKPDTSMRGNAPSLDAAIRTELPAEIARAPIEPAVPSSLPVAPSPPPPTVTAATDESATELAPPVVAVDAAPPALASTADAKRYARDVAVALARTRPKGVGRSGRVEIEFTIAAVVSAPLSRVHVARSSGVAQLDTLARRAVERATFPPPPVGLTDAARTFRVPFNFD